MEKHAAMIMLTSGTATSLVSTATGLLVAMAAAWSYNNVRERIEKLDSEMSQNALDITGDLNAHLKRLGRSEHSILGPHVAQAVETGPKFSIRPKPAAKKAILRNTTIWFVSNARAGVCCRSVHDFSIFLPADGVKRAAAESR
jgi:hypothetical protein